MPTYTCTSQTGLIVAEQQRLIAHGIAEIHSRCTGTPIGFAQCIFREVSASGHFIGGVQAPAESVWVLGHLRGGRSTDVLNGILSGITKLMVDVLHISETMVWVYLAELNHDQMVEFGRVLPEVGEEARWVSQLPDELRDRFSLDPPIGLGGSE